MIGRALIGGGARPPHGFVAARVAMQTGPKKLVYRYSISFVNVERSNNIHTGSRPTRPRARPRPTHRAPRTPPSESTVISVILFYLRLLVGMRILRDACDSRIQPNLQPRQAQGYRRVADRRDVGVASGHSPDDNNQQCAGLPTATDPPLAAGAVARVPPATRRLALRKGSRPSLDRAPYAHGHHLDQRNCLRLAERWRRVAEPHPYRRLPAAHPHPT